MGHAAKSPQPVVYIWDDRSLSFSPNVRLAPHHHGAAELIVALDKPFLSIINGRTEVSTGSLLIPPAVQHQNCHQDSICPILYLDAEGRDYKMVAKNLTPCDGVFQNLPFETSLRHVFNRIYRERPAAKQVHEWLQGAIFGAQAPVRPTLDPRIEKILALIQSDLAENHSIDCLAAEVSLSPDRLMHLFSEQVGIPLRKYRLWKRLKQASMLYFEGNNLTYAAHATGFVDSSHYIKSFHRLFGTQPGSFLSKRRGLALFFG